MLLAFSICLLLSEVLYLQMKVNAYLPTGYIGCFNDWHYRVLTGINRKSNTNSGDECKHYCKSHDFIYAGTESEDECFCGNNIRVQERSSDCTHRCPGNRQEICGGHWRISIYDTRRCATSPCKNGATCVDIDTDNYNCSCSDKWTGKNCETKIETTTLKTSSLTSSTSNIPLTSTSRNSTTSKTSSTQVETTEVKTQLSTRIKATTNFPNMKTTDNSSMAMVAIYVSLPVSLIIILAIAAVFLKRRLCHKKEPLPDVISHGTGSVQNIYANLTSLQLYKAQGRNMSNNSSGNIKKNTGKGLEFTDKERSGRLKQGMEEYNKIALKPINRTANDNSYDHVVNLTCSSDKTYSKLSTMQVNNARTCMAVNDTYSHIKSSSGQSEISYYTDTCNNIYSTLKLRNNPKADRTDALLKEYSVYDRTDTGVSVGIEGDNYSHMGTVISVRNDYGDQRSVGVENIYYNEDQYATVQKVSKE